MTTCLCWRESTISKLWDRFFPNEESAYLGYNNISHIQSSSLYIHFRLPLNILEKVEINVQWIADEIESNAFKVNNRQIDL